MHNRSKDLRDLFRQSLINKNKKHNVRIFFYEWSELTGYPRVFASLNDFKLFLQTCGIFIDEHQCDIINNVNIAYASCYRGTRYLHVCDSWLQLRNRLDEYDKNNAEFKDNCMNNIHLPKLIFENTNTYPMNDGTFFG